MRYTRQLCSTERIYVVYNEFCPPFLNQFFWEGSGVFDGKKWREAVRAASEANPGSRAVIKGCTPFTRLVDTGITPPVHEVDGKGWDALGPEGAPARMLEGLNPFEGPSAEVILIHGDPLRVVVRSHHGVMDGRGNLTWAEDIFRCLRGEAPLGAASRLTEYQIAATYQKQGRGVKPSEYLAPTGMPQGSEPGVIWRRHRYPGRYKNLMGQVAVLLAQEAWKHGQGKVRFSIPVDMRSRIEGLRSTGNLTNLIYTDITPGTTPADVSRDVASQLEARNDGMIYWGDRLIRYIPFWLLRRLIRSDNDKKDKSGRYPNSGILSNMQRMPVYSGAGFEGKYCWGIPPGQLSSPIFVGIVSTAEDMTLIYSMSRVLASNGRLDKLIENVSAGLVAS